MNWKRFKAMGTEIVITASLNEEQGGFLDVAEKNIAEFEKRFSRFLEDSELSQFNRAPAGEIPVSHEMSDILTEAKKLHSETGGVFDPTIINSLTKVGYNKSFDKIIGNTGQPDASVTPDLKKIAEEFLKRPKMDELNVLDNKVKKTDGLMIDLGGIGKGYITDKLSTELFVDVPSFWISAGGDLTVKGNDENGNSWKVGVQDPNSPEKEIFYLRTNGEQLGIATSGIHKRKGDTGGYKWHHIIDPRSGLPVENDILAVTVVSSGATKADVYAKTVLVLGQEEGLKFIDDREDSACIIFFKNGEIKFSKRASMYL